jgi:chaperonin GroES
MKKKSSGLKEAAVGVRPLADRVLIKEIDDRQTMTASGIYIPETVDGDKGNKKGTIIAVGEGRFDDGVLVPVQVKVGQKVMFQWGDKLKVEGEEYYIVRESEIVAVIK